MPPDTLPNPEEILNSMVKTRNDTGRSFHIKRSASGTKVNPTSMDGGFVYIDTSYTSSGGGSPTGSVLEVKKVRQHPSVGGVTSYSVTTKAGTDSSVSVSDEGRTVVYRIPITAEGIDNRDMPCLTVITDEKEESGGSPPPEESSDSTEEDSDSDSDYICHSNEFRQKLLGKISEAIDASILASRKLGISDTWHEVEDKPSGIIYHCKDDAMHEPGNGGSDCFLCNPA